ncbi:hypothetical protein ACFWU3_06705 [Streptomyces sp. NPDC058685]|uniref:hypothetical protein n=1 Tax=Streptomyces sp. NPDC058685 TaxID=3346598 RepID=UPI003650180C
MKPSTFVTGASSGIGFEPARQLADRGFDRVTTPRGPADKVLPDKAKAEAHRRMAEPGSSEGTT